MEMTSHMGHKVLKIENLRRHYRLKKLNNRTKKVFTVMICKFAHC